jgi:hypothetical protein
MHRWEAAVRVNLDYWGASHVLEGDPHAAQVASVWFSGLALIDRAINAVADKLVGWVPRWAARVAGVESVVEEQDRKLIIDTFHSCSALAGASASLVPIFRANSLTSPAISKPQRNLEPRLTHPRPQVLRGRARTPDDTL